MPSRTSSSQLPTSIYLDHAAATPLDPRVERAMMPFWATNFANAGSLHTPGRKARLALNQSRQNTSRILGCNPDEIYFTNGGTESINMALVGYALANKKFGNHIITSAIEHAAVLDTLTFLKTQGFTYTLIPVDAAGLVNINDITKAITNKTILISLMMANNEIGALQPVATLGKALIAINKKRKHKIVLHTDACQAGNYLPLNINKLHVDLMSLSGCKLYGPKASGLLFIKRGLKLAPIIHGGGQERGLKSGTENIAGIVGLSTALALAQKMLSSENKRLTSLRDYFWKQIHTLYPSAKLNGHPIHRLPNNLNVSFPGFEGETLLYTLDKAGIAVATGSACSETSQEPSHVLRALGLSAALAGSCLRFTLGRQTTKKDLDYTLKILGRTLKKIAKRSAGGTVFYRN